MGDRVDVFDSQFSGREDWDYVFFVGGVLYSWS